jgi:hypothetical protein
LVPGPPLDDTILAYNPTVFSNGDLSGNCSAGFDQNQASGSFYLPAITNGAQNGGCLAPLDFPPIPVSGGQSGFWLFRIERGVPLTQYVDPDPGHPLNGLTVTFGEQDCSVSLWKKDDLVWTHTTLAEAFR